MWSFKGVNGQNQLAEANAPDKPTYPRLIVGIVVDQMKYDYLYRFWDQYDSGGFRRLINEGFVVHNASYNYIPTYTAPGHTSIYTGSTPSLHGIISNDWYDRSKNRSIYCAEDSAVSPLGGKAGYMSPKNILTTTITDELRIATNFKSKVIGVALKDRGAIMPAGHSANAAYWFDPSSGNWISSTWYMKKLPDWVTDFNNQKLPERYLKQPWNTLLPIEEYKRSTTDDNRYEQPFNGEARPVFPHDVPALSKGDLGFIRSVPAGNSLTKDFAIAAIRSESIGRNSVTDFLCVSFSPTDYIGHRFGTHSIELQDCYLRLDRDLQSFFNFLDETIGSDNYLVFLTADHAAVPNPLFLNDHNLPGGFFRSSKLADSLNHYLSGFSEKGNWVLRIDNDQVYLNHDLIQRNKISLEKVQKNAADFLRGFDEIAEVITATALNEQDFVKPPLSLLENGFNSKRSGDVAFILKPGYFDWSRTTGTSHGSPYAYDTHVPLIFMGWKIKKGSTVRKVDITDIAPTISMMLNCDFPSGCTGKPIEELFK